MDRNCIVCDKQLAEDIDFEDPPMGGVCFQSPGNFGSTVFDPMDGTEIEINVCDKCLVEKKKFVVRFKTITTAIAKPKIFKEPF